MNRRSISTRLFALALAGVLLPAAASFAVEGEEPNRGGELNLDAQDPQVALERLQPAEGYEVSLFATEQDFPIGNPVAMAFDDEGRLWVATMPTYPQYNPGDPPTDKLIILEDTDGDGRADEHTVFADGLHLAAGFELGDGGVYIAQQPNLVFLKDTDGDDRADEHTVILHGFGTEDSHHAISAFTWGPGGGLYFQEGTFHHSQVETPHGPVRLENAGVFRYEPRTEKLSVFVSYGFANPWGHVFDRWGQSFVSDASGGSNYYGTPFSGHVDYPRKHPGMREWTLTKVRPTSGCEFVYSSHFPEEAQGNFLLNNVIGFHGIKQYRTVEDGSGFVGEEVEPLLQSSDINFRPVDLQFGPDGALYVVDWFNPLIGHMQYSLRDPRRDHSHGRIWRVTHKDRPLLEPVNIAEKNLEEQLDLLKAYEDRTRYRVRRALREHDTEEVVAALESWVVDLDESDEHYEHHLLEALWVYQHHNVVNEGLLHRLLRAEDYHARAAATRVLQYWRDRVASPMRLLEQQVNDDHPRVRLEAVVALSFIPSVEAAEIALQAVRHPMDYYLDYALTETMATLEGQWKSALADGEPFAADNAEGVQFILDGLGPQELAHVARSRPVYHALLTRSGIDAEHRKEALVELAKENDSTPAEELIAAIDRVDGKQGGGDATEDLADLLTTIEPNALAGVRDELARLAAEGNDPAVRRASYVAMIRADGEIDRAWQAASESPRRLADLLRGVAMLEDEDRRADLYPRIQPILSESSQKSAEEEAVRGRYVRVSLPSEQPSRTLTLAEVQVFSGGENVARRGKAEQSSTASGGTADRAIDGNTSGTYNDGSSTHTQERVDSPWWEVDLGETVPITAVTIWNRTDGNLGNRLHGFTLTVLDSDRRPVFTDAGNPAPSPSVTFELGDDAAGQLRRAAIDAVSRIPGHEGEAFALLSRAIRNGTGRSAAIEAIQRIPQEHWSPEEIGPLAESIVGYAEKFPSSERTGRTFGDVLQLGRDLAARLPEDRAGRINDALDALAVKIVRIEAVVAQMRYDIEAFTVRPGQEIEIVFDNPDHMPHNLLVTEPGSMSEVGTAAEAMVTQPDAFAKQFIPDTPKVLHATDLIEHGETARLRFTAPDNPGDYPYLCTFPGHWRTMNGVMEVE